VPRAAPHRFRGAARVLEKLVADPTRLRHSGGAEDRDGEQGKGGTYGDPDGNSDPDQHAPAPRSGIQPLFAARPTRRGTYAAAIREASSPAGAEPAGKSLRYLARDLRGVGSE